MNKPKPAWVELSDEEWDKICRDTEAFVDSLEPGAVCDDCGLFNDNDAPKCKNCGCTNLLRDRY
ncbi:MAG: hypothetical protein ACXADB_11440 [Candidatus Hermodarchaeia archaeon]|jgi:hypothetical protein